jgi:transposase InsO family protein
MKILRTDNGGEFTSTMIDQLLAEKDIKRELTAADSPQENGSRNRVLQRTIFRRSA